MRLLLILICIFLAESRGRYRNHHLKRGYQIHREEVGKVGYGREEVGQMRGRGIEELAEMTTAKFPTGTENSTPPDTNILLKKTTTESTENCGEFPEVANSVRIVQENRVGEYVVFVCSKGYEIEGPHVVTCLSNRNWSTSPTCRVTVEESANQNCPTVTCPTCPATTCPTVTSPTVTCPTCPQSPVVTCPAFPSVDCSTLTQPLEKLSNLTFFESGLSWNDGINYVKRQNKFSELRFLIHDGFGRYKLEGKFSAGNQKLFPEFLSLMREKSRTLFNVNIKYEKNLFANTYNSMDCVYLTKGRAMRVLLNNDDVVEGNFFIWFKLFAAITEEGNLCEDDKTYLQFFTQLKNRIIFPNLNYQTVELWAWILRGHVGSFLGDCAEETPQFEFKGQKLFSYILLKGFCFNYLTSGLKNAAVWVYIRNTANHLICAAESCHIRSDKCTYENSTTRAAMNTWDRSKCSEEQCQTMVRNKDTSCR